MKTLPRFDPAAFTPPLRTRLLVLQPTPFCNIDCSYCYLPGRDAKARMSVDTVRAVARRLVTDDLVPEALTVVWHAGEPLAVPPAFYEEAFAALDQALGARCALTQSIQTNATLIDERWCALFAKHRVQVGISIDGPAALHDRHRLTRRGHGTHARVMRGAAMLREHGLAFHAIAVVTAATLREPAAFIRFFAEELKPTELGLNYDEAEGAHRASSLEGHEQAHAALLQALLQEQAGGRLDVRELAQARRLVATPLPRWRCEGVADEPLPDNAQVLPFAIVNVAADGSFGSFSPELLGQPHAAHADFLLGNVHACGFFEAARSERFAALWGEILQGVQRCRESCAHWAWCGGGAPANKLYEAGTMAAAETLYCRTMLKRPFDAVLKQLEFDVEISQPK